MKFADLQTAPKWFETAFDEIGVSEKQVDQNSRILEYHMTTTMKAKTDEISWCSSFVNWCFWKNNLQGTKSAAARSWATWGFAVKDPLPGCVAVFWRGTKDGWQGHVGFFFGLNADKDIIVLGGNQNNQVSIQVYPKNQLLGYRWPFKI